MNISLALSSLDYLDKETEFVPWYAALNEIGYIRNMLLTKAIFGKFEVCNLLRIISVLWYNIDVLTAQHHITSFSRYEIILYRMGE